MKKAQLLKKQIIIFTLICIIVSFVVPAFNKNVYAATTQSGKKIAEAAHNENNEYYGGVPGDSTGDEVRIKDYSNYSNGGYNEVMRYKPDDDSEETKKVREKGWFTRGTKLVFNGFRRNGMFFVKKYTNFIFI